jgi:DNA-binding response OmpR family regulator
LSSIISEFCDQFSFGTFLVLLKTDDLEQDSKLVILHMKGERKSVLVVDDDQSILRSTEIILQKEGYKVEVAETGKEALEKLQDTHYDVVLLDVRLPDMEGTDILLQMNNARDTVKIMITGFSNVELGKKAADYGANDFLVKPIRPEEFVSTIRERLSAVQPES